jgi:hypothetical protein
MWLVGKENIALSTLPLTYLHTYLPTSTGQRRALLQKPIVSQSRNTTYCMDPKSLLPHLKDLATFPWSEQYEPTPRLHIQISNMHFNITFWFKPRFSKWSVCLIFPHQNPVCVYLLPYTYYVPFPSLPPRADHSNNIWYIIELLISKFLELSILIE